MKNAAVFALLATLISAAFGCTSTTVISSSDPGAKIYVDGMLLGHGTVTYSDQKIIGSTTTIMMKKDGCEAQTYLMSRSEEFDAGACAGGVFLLVPFLWVEKYHPQHTYEFECQKKSAANESAAPLKNSKTARN